jgi:ubiquinone/menaquinone biosynthesis C-methylase UbiE
MTLTLQIHDGTSLCAAIVYRADIGGRGMSEPRITFEDGGAYERIMGVWSQRAGAVFLDWLAPADGLRWLDVGCGNGAFTELLFARHAPLSVDGIDPSAAQIEYARHRPGTSGATFRQGDAMALPYQDAAFDAAVMALVIFFVPDPARGVAEMARVVRPGGRLSAYAWNVPDGGVPITPVWDELAASGLPFALPPSADASRIEALRALWTAAGLREIETTEITVQRDYDSFEEYFETILLSPNIANALNALDQPGLSAFKTRLRQRMGVAESGPITRTARANAVKGVVG